MTGAKDGDVWFDSSTNHFMTMKDGGITKLD